MKKFLRILFVALGLWLFLFQGTVVPETAGETSQEVLAGDDGFVILLRFVIFVVILRIFMEFLHWYVYDRKSVVSERI